MYNFIIRKLDIPIDEVMSLIQQLRDQFGYKIDIFEFEWLNYTLYISLRTTNDVMREIRARFQYELFDQWNIIHDEKIR